MAKISTKQPDQSGELQEVHRSLIDLVESASGGAIASGAAYDSGSTIQETVKALELLIVVLHETGVELSAELLDMNNQLVIQALMLEEQDRERDRLRAVPYDEALDHAAADLIDAFSGSVEESNVTADGSLSFDGHVTITKGDLKPILREAIRRWIDLKVR